MQRAANVWDRFYRHHESPWRGERPVEDLLPLLGAGPVLELGCGNGKLLKPLAAAGIDVVGLDFSWHILSRLPAGIPCVMADASVLPLVDSTFSAVLDIHCSGHLLAAGRRNAAAECFRVLRPGGTLVVERLTPNDLRAGQGSPVADEPGVRALQDGRTTHFAGPDELAAAFREVGFVPGPAAVDRHYPGHRGRQVTRESVRLLLERPASAENV